MNNKGQTGTMKTILYVALTLVGIYLFIALLGVKINIFGVDISIPFFTQLKSIINYFIMILIWIMVQVGMIYAYYRVGKFVVDMSKNMKGFVQKWGSKIKQIVSA